ncbi:kielin/chordin-like protein [Panulirus ornatus]|uniref:kielin/chordin-like protein n=1 Tax=Panulirus ornatus TaxID=150431 RepID=UPI003A8529B1
MAKVVEGSRCVRIIFSLLLLVLLLSPAELLPVYHESDVSQDHQGFRKRCIDPEECCVFSSDVGKFKECCRDHGCCPLTCHGTHYESVDLTPTKDCKRAWECCRFVPHTQEFEQCCSAHGCCPVCSQVVRGCCYNDVLYEWGRSVEEFTEACLKLVCAVQVTSSKPFFSAIIAPVRLPDHLCDGRTGCDDCVDYYCVDETGLIRGEDERWSLHKCQECQCKGGVVICQRLDQNCPSKPNGYCVEVPGPCCPEWNCTLPESWALPISGRMNVKENKPNLINVGRNTSEEEETSAEITARLRWGLSSVIKQLFGHKLSSYDSRTPKCVLNGQEGQEWNTDDPCIVSVCTREGIKEKHKHCHETLPQHPDCLEVTPEGQCCPEWNCSGCFVEDGTFHVTGSEWESGVPCIVLVCTGGGIVEKPEECDSIATPSPNCFEHTPEGECCPEWNCSGCLDDESEFHSLGDLWQSSPCATSVCTEHGVYDIKVKCHQEPKPHDNCQEVTLEGSCCPEWVCSGCVKDGTVYEIGTESPTDDPCVTFLCKESGVEMNLKSCGWTERPTENCFLHKLEGQCCEEWNCSGCEYNGNYHELHSEWPSDDPCSPWKCSERGIKKTLISCPWTEPPNINCFFAFTKGECCGKWNCSGCYEGGVYHEVGSEWITSHPCIASHCTDEGIIKKYVSCPWTPSPLPNCFLHKPEGECCEKWNCSGCLANGTYHPLKHEWKTDLCSVHVCTNEGVETTYEECDPQPHPSCKKSETEEECCPQWICSGCFKDGSYYELFSDFTVDDPCLIFTCTPEGIEESFIYCDWLPPPQPNCFDDPEEDCCCCQSWNCSGCLDSGAYFPLDHVWKSDNCTTKECTEFGILETQEVCELKPRPHPSCKEVRPEGVAAKSGTAVVFKGHVYVFEKDETNSYDLLFNDNPLEKKWDMKLRCREKASKNGCLYDGKFYPLHRKWKTDICTTNVCTADGIQVLQEDCVLGPQPHHECEVHQEDDECCPQWTCSGCFDKENNYYELGSVSSSNDPCIDLHCSEEGLQKTHKSCVWTKRPSLNCFEYTPEGECCGQWNCSGCIDADGTYYPLFHIWQIESCIRICTNKGIRTKPECNQEPAPHDACKEIHRPDKCCPEWSCSVCIGEDGTNYELGSETKTSDPCVVLQCTEKGLEEKTKTCNLTEPPEPSCFGYIPEGYCCKEWKCSGCTDDDGIYHHLYDLWHPDPCTTSICLKDRIETSHKTCKQRPPHPSCWEYTPPGECCPTWDCSVTTTSATPSSPLLSGCVDGSGLHKFGDKWKDPSNRCTELECGIYGRIVKNNICDLAELEDPIIQLFYG